jgi:hypothetical protein
MTVVVEENDWRCGLVTGPNEAGEVRDHFATVIIGQLNGSEEFGFALVSHFSSTFSPKRDCYDGSISLVGLRKAAALHQEQ